VGSWVFVQAHRGPDVTRILFWFRQDMSHLPVADPNQKKTRKKQKQKKTKNIMFNTHCNDRVGLRLGACALIIQCLLDVVSQPDSASRSHHPMSLGCGLST
jgi:hypothetical protein